MRAHRTGLVLAIALLFAAPASAQWIVLVQRQSDGTWDQPNRVEDTELQAYAQARRMCVHSSNAIVSRTGAVPRTKISAVKIISPGMDPGQAKATTCAALGVPTGTTSPAAPTGSSTSTVTAPAATVSSGLPPSAIPSNPLGALKRLAEGLSNGSRSSPNAVHPQASGSLAFDVVGLQLGMAPAAADSAVREHMGVGWVFVRDRSERPMRASAYESMKGYLAHDLSEAILVYFEPSLVNGTLVGVRRFSMIGKKVDPAALEAALVQKYGHPAVAGKHTWAWGQPSGCTASGTGVLKPQDLTFLGGPARGDPEFKQALASALDLATYHSAVKPEYWSRCRPVLQVLRTATNGVMTTLADQKFTMDQMAPARYDSGAIEF